MAVPKALLGDAATGEKVSFHLLWSRRHTTKFNGVSYRVQRAAAATYTPEGRRQEGLSSWDFFDRLLERANVVGTPGAGFGPSGEGYFRLSAFNSREKVEEAIDRITRASW